MIKLKSLMLETVLENESRKIHISPEDRQNSVFMSGFMLAKRDVMQDKTTNIHGLPDDFVRGYKTFPRRGMWGKMNNWMTDKLGQLGSSMNNRTWREEKN